MAEPRRAAGATNLSASIDSFIRDFVGEIVRTREPPPEDSLDKELIGQSVGRYRVLSLLGKGGMGRVYEAEDVELGRRVAMKFLPPSLTTRPESLERFLRERSVTAELEHPGIVPIYDSGVWLNGRPFYIMRKVGGAPLDRLIKRAVTPAERLALLGNIIAVADAVGFAHHHGVIHRDLKPANVLVASFGETLVADWGLAKRIRGPEPDASELAAAEPVAGETSVGAVVGTPAYMAPEQARGEPVDERADVYAIGAMLHELLTGKPPEAHDGSEPSTISVAKRPMALEYEPVARTLNDLTAIVDKALSPEPGERYANAAELADELRRFQTGQLVGARRYTRLELLRRWAIRHRSMLLVAAAMGAALVVVAALSVARIVRERDTANRARKEAAARNDQLVLLQARAELEQDPTASLAWLKTYPASSPDWQAVSEIASDAWSRGVARYVWRGEQPFPARALAVSPDGTLVAAGSKEKGLHLWELGTGRARWLPSDVELGGPVLFAPDGKWVVSSNGTDAVRIWELATGTRRAIDKMNAARLTFTSDGRLLLGAGRIEGADVWDATTGKLRSLAAGGRAPTAAAVVPGEHAASLVVGNAAFVEDLDSGERTRLGQLRAMPFRGSIAVSSDARWVAIGAVRSVILFDRRTGAARVLPAGVDKTSNVRFAPDGTLFSFGQIAGALRWDLERGTAHPLDTRDEVRALSWSSQGHMLVGAENGHLSLYEALDEPARPLLGHDGTISSLTFSPDGRWAISSSTDRTVRAWPIGEGDLHVFHHAASPHLSSDGRSLLVARSGDWAAELIDVATGRSQLLTEPRPFVWSESGAISPDGRQIVYSDADRKLTLFDRSTGQRRTLVQYGPANTLDLAESFSPDGSRLAIVSNDGRIQLTTVATGALQLLGRHDAEPTATHFSRDGRTLLTAGRDRVIKLWDLFGTGAPRVLRGHAAEVFDAEFSRDGDRVVSSCADGTVRVWDVATGESRVLRGHNGSVWSAYFAPDGRTVISGSDDRTVRLWDTETGESRVLRRSGAPIWAVVFSPDGTSILWSGAEGVVRMSDLAATPGLDKNATRLRAWLDAETTAEVDASGVLASRPR